MMMQNKLAEIKKKNGVEFSQTRINLSYAKDLAGAIERGDISVDKPKGTGHTKYCPNDGEKLNGKVFTWGTYDWVVTWLKCPRCNYEYAKNGDMGLIQYSWQTILMIIGWCALLLVPLGIGVSSLGVLFYNLSLFWVALIFLLLGVLMMIGGATVFIVGIVVYVFSDQSAKQ